MMTPTQSPKAVGIAGVSVGILLLLIFILGFFGTAPRSESPAPAPKMARQRDFAKESAMAAPTPYGDILQRSGALYYRQADMQLAVGDTLQANDEMEKIANEHKCQIVNLVIEGNDQSRRCSVEFQVPSDHFDSLVRKLRKVGTVLHERITAQRIEGKRTLGGDERAEFAAVRAEIIDDGARRGVFARSFETSGNHFVVGSALLLEGTGYILPFLLTAAGLAALFQLAKRMRRKSLQ
jgi:hypothetical protein